MTEGGSAKVYFIGAGPGDPELITVKGARLIREAGLVLYAGSLVPEEVIACASKEAKVLDSASMTLEETHAALVSAVRGGVSVARVHTGDPALYGAVREQAALLERDGIAYEMVPGVSVAFAAAAAARVSFTLPEKAQSLILTRLGGRTLVPEAEQLRDLARHQTSMAVYLSAAQGERVARELLEGGYSPETPVIVCHRVGWPDERLIRTRLSELPEAVGAAGIHRQAIFLVLPGQEETACASRLYAEDFKHGFRP